MANVFIIKPQHSTNWYGPYATREMASDALQRLRSCGDSLDTKLYGKARILEAEPNLYRPLANR